MLMSLLYVIFNTKRSERNESFLQDTKQFHEDFKCFLNWHFFYDDYNWRKAFMVEDFGVSFASPSF